MPSVDNDYSDPPFAYVDQVRCFSLHIQLISQMYCSLSIHIHSLVLAHTKTHWNDFFYWTTLLYVWALSCSIIFISSRINEWRACEVSVGVSSSIPLQVGCCIERGYASDIITASHNLLYIKSSCWHRWSVKFFGFCIYFEQEINDFEICILKTFKLSLIDLGPNTSNISRGDCRHS